MKIVSVFLITVLSTFLLPAPVQAGSIEGRISARAVTPPTLSENNAYRSRRFRFAEQVDYGSLQDFVVYIEPDDGGRGFSYTGRAEVVTQENAVFDPHVLPVAVGTTVEWPNEDDIFHNVFSFSEPAPFDLGYYKDERKAVTFTRPGRVDVFCAIHKDMHCIILVLPTLHFASAGPSGRYRIENVPAGTYTLKAWHERLPPQVREVTVPEEGTVEADFEMGVKGLPKY